MIIYMITNNLTNKRYIGQTTMKLNARLSKHRNCKKGVMYHAFKKHGYDNFNVEIIDYAETYEELNEKEIYWINYYDTYNHGYNRTKGGSSNLGFNHSEESKNKIRKGLKEYEMTDKHKDMLSLNHADFNGCKNPNYGNKNSEITRKKMGIKNIGKKYRKGKKHTEESKEKNRLAHLGLYEGSKNPNYGKGKSVINLTTGETFISSIEAGEKYSILPSGIRQACKRQGNAGGYAWRYECGVE